MKRWTRSAVCAAVLYMTSFAATRDFLSAEEIDQVRAAQDPNMRVQLYLKFAQQRVAQMNQLLRRERAGRTALLHDLLEDYSGITDALSTVTDDALRRKVDLTKGIAAVVSGEESLLVQLKNVLNNPPTDIARYEFVLKDAIDATEDLLELTGDLGARAQEIRAKDQQEDAARDANLDPEEAKKRAAEKAKQAKDGKAPTLRRPGEVVPPKR
jgi:hypothetical protein